MERRGGDGRIEKKKGKENHVSSSPRPRESKIFYESLVTTVTAMIL